MKKILFILLILPFISFSQTLVTTMNTAKNVVLEEFTGIYCQFCPDGHRIAEELSSNNPDRVVAINIHTGGYANPNPGAPDFRTSGGDNIQTISGLTGYPAGQVNRRLFNGLAQNGSNGLAMSRGNWEQAANTVLEELSPVNVGFASSYDPVSRQITVDVEVYYTGTSGLDNNITVALLQNNVPGPQTGGSTYNPSQILSNGDYNHMHMLRKIITDSIGGVSTPWGDVIPSSSTTQGNLITKTYTWTLPQHISGPTYTTSTNPVMVACDPNNMDVAVFVSEGQQNILTGGEAPLGGSNDGSAGVMIGTLIPTTPYGTSNIGTSTTLSLDAVSLLSGNQDFTFTLTTDAPADWNADFTINGNNFSNSGTVSLAYNQNQTVDINVTPGNSAAYATYTLSMQSTSIPTASSIVGEVYVISGVTDLIVSNSSAWGDGSNAENGGAAVFEQDFIDGLTLAGNTSYGLINETDFMFLSYYGALANVEHAYFNFGWTFPSLTDILVTEIQSFMDNGGNVFMSGQDVAWASFDAASTYATVPTQTFLNNYFHLGYVSDGTYTPGDPNTNTDIYFHANHPNFSSLNTSPIFNYYGNAADGTPYVYPEEVEPYDDPFQQVVAGEPVFYYRTFQLNPFFPMDTICGAIRNPASVNYKSVFFGVGIEQFGDVNVKTGAVKAVHDYFHGIVNPAGFDNAISNIFSNNTYPNPANDYSILDVSNFPNGGNIVINDTKGNLVKSIRFNAGQETVKINTSDLSSSTYIYKVVCEKSSTEGKILEVIH